MDKKHDSDKDISADALLQKLKENMAEAEQGDLQPADGDSDKRKRFRFRRSEKSPAYVTEADINKEMPEDDDSIFESPVPRSEIEELDIDALMKKYLSEEEYSKLSKKDREANREEEELVSTLNSFDTIKAEIKELDDESDMILPDAEMPEEVGEVIRIIESDEYIAPDDELFSVLSENGKVCDLPEDVESSESDTKQVPNRALDLTKLGIALGDSEDTVVISDIKDLEKVINQNAKGGDPDGKSPEETQAFETPSSDTVMFTLRKEEDDAENDGSEKENTVAFEAIPEELAPVPAENAEEAEELDDADFDAAYAEAFDETDANLMIAFGMDEELDKALGKENADKLRADNDNISEEEAEKPKKQKKEKKTDIKEFITPVEAKEIFEAYKVKFGRNALKLFGMVAVVIVLFFYENISVLGGKLPEAVDPKYYPAVNVMVGLQFLFVGFAIMAGRFIDGVKSLIDKKPTPYSVLPLILAVSVIYSVMVCFFAPSSVPVTFNFPASLCLLFAVLGERMDLRREVMTFNIISSRRTKFALEKLELDDAELETKAFDKFMPKQPSVFKINKTSFIDGYFHRTNEYPSTKLVLKAFIPVSAAIFVASFVLGLIIMKDWQSAAMLAYTAFFFSLPATVFITFALPSFRASKLAFNENSAFVGESALDEYTTAGSISFDDRDVFPTSGVKLRSVKVFGSGRLDTVIYNVASIYSILGGPLSDVLNVATADLGRSENTEIIAVDNEGVEAVVDDCHIFAGKADYLRRKGYVPVADSDDDEIIAGGEISIMFLVCDDEVVAKLYIRYKIDPAFEVTLKRLYRSGICVGIKTVDPNINDEMLSTRIKLAKYPVRVLKYSDISETKRGSDRTDSGIVSKKSAKALLGIFTLCDKIKHVTKANITVNIITVITGLIICFAVSAIGNIAGVSSIYVALFQAFWIIPVYLLSKFMLL